MTLEAIKFRDYKLELLDQLRLPDETVYVEIKSVKDGWDAIHQMKVRGAPAIAIAGVLSLAVELRPKEFGSVDELVAYAHQSLDYLVTSRPTAVNMADASSKLKSFTQTLAATGVDVQTFKQKLLDKMSRMLEEDVAVNRSIGDHGAAKILEAEESGEGQVRILTHCNTGSLATAGYGTALGVVRSLFAQGRLEHCFCTETRPYNQGSRLTAYELVYEQMPATLICDSMVGILLATKRVSAIVVGADRVVANGDTANKIGTYQLAILARHHRVPFYVAVPTTSVDLGKRTGAEIVIEERPAAEMTYIKGQRVAAHGINAWNPSFDVTPAELITGLITEHGVFAPHELEAKLKSLAASQ